MLIIAAAIMRKGAAAGIGTRGLSDANGVARIDYEGMMWISSLKLSQLNATRRMAEGDYNIKEESYEMIQKFHSYSVNKAISFSYSLIRLGLGNLLIKEDV
jgi:hypothetical protein